jgi:hypothetical protein
MTTTFELEDGEYYYEDAEYSEHAIGLLVNHKLAKPYEVNILYIEGEGCVHLVGHARLHSLSDAITYYTRQIEMWEFHEKCTCKDCPDNQTCKWAWDGYNTDGDCLAMK